MLESISTISSARESVTWSTKFRRPESTPQSGMAPMRTATPVATGMYFYRVKAGDFMDNKKMLLIK